uniref:Enoyl-CoA hydratase n=1 Tax=Romanomermis culicivorax TaxID=13658 RepID=A0A915IYZ1_ROMCU
MNEIATVGCNFRTMDLDMKRSKPLIAALEGYVVGSGLELALFCDIRIASENVSFGFLNRRYGLPLVDGGTVRLPQLIGLSRAIDLILTGRCLDAKVALEWGLVHKVVTVGAVLGQAFSLASTLCNFPNDAIKADLESVIHACSKNISQDDALNYEKENSRKAFPQGVK